VRLTAAAAATALVALAAPSPATAARAVSIAPFPGEPAATAPLLVDMTATATVRGRAAKGAQVEVSARCSLRPCVTTVTANRKGRWRARLHLIVPPQRRLLFVRAAYPGTEGATEHLKLAAPVPAAAGAPELTVIGDSLAQGFSPFLPELLPGWRVTVDAARSRFLLEGMSILATMRKPARRPVVAAFSLFTNDDPSRAAELAAWARQSLASLPPGSCALWATIARPKVNGVSYAEANRLLEEVAEQEPRLIVVPWAETVRSHRRWLREDRVHATTEGYRARAELYAEAARACPLSG
jgi:hypothetical protein